MEYLDKKNENKEFELYTLAEIAYEKNLKNNIHDIDSLYPEGWYEKTNYTEKIKIISEAIREKKLIANTARYQNSIEGVKKILNKKENNF